MYMYVLIVCFLPCAFLEIRLPLASWVIFSFPLNFEIRAWSDFHTNFISMQIPSKY